MTSSGVIITDTGFQDCSIYDVVAFNPKTNSYIKAQPTWVLDNDTVKPSDEAYVAGIVCSVPDVSGTAQLLINGVIELNDRCEVPGEYYLAAGGRMALGAPSGVLPVYCGYRASSGKFIFKPAAPAYAGHRHTVYELDSTKWAETAAGSGIFVYNDTTDPTCQQLLASVPINTLIAVIDGVVLTPVAADETGALKLNADGDLEYTKTAGSSAPTSCTLYGTNPLATIEPEVRSVAPASGNNVLTASKAYGTVYLDVAYPIISSTNYTGVGVTSITNTGLTTAPVVHRLNKGTGIDILPGELPGVYTLNAGSVAGTMIDFQTINANNVLIGATANGPLLTFPAGIVSSVVGIARIPLSSIDWKFQVFLWVSGVSDELDLTVCVQDPPSADAPANIAIPNATETIAGAGSVNQLTLLTSEVEYSGAGNSLVTVTLSADTPGTPINLKAFGVLLTSNV